MTGEDMLKIAVLSDALNANKLKEYIVRYSIYNNNDYDISAFTKANKLLEGIGSGSIYNIIFIDIDINDDVMKKIHYMRRHFLEDETAIIFLSSSQMCSVELLKLRPFNFISYPLKYELISECIDEYYQIKRKNNRLFKYERNKARFEIEVSQIVYFQSSGRKVIIHTLSEELDFYGKLSDCLKQQCCKGFIQTHQSYLVNPIHVKHKENSNIVVIGNINLPISRQGMLKIKEKYE